MLGVGLLGATIRPAMSASSDDDGRTWSGPRLVIDPADPPGAIKRRTLVGNFWSDPSGRLSLLPANWSAPLFWTTLDGLALKCIQRVWAGLQVVR